MNDNAKNNLNDKERYNNLEKILITTLNDMTRKGAKNYLCALLTSILDKHFLDWRSKIYPSIESESTFINLVKDIVQLPHFWEGKAESRIGLNANKIPDGILKIRDILSSNEMSIEDKRKKIKETAAQKILEHDKYAKSIFSMPKDPITVEFYHIIQHDNIDHIKLLLEFKMNHASPVSTPHFNFPKKE